MQRCLRATVVGLLFAGLCVSPVGARAALAQGRATTADLAGLVVDASRAVLPGVTVTIINAGTGLERVVTSGADGRFTIPALPPGTYSLRLELSGFATEVH